MIKAVLFDLDGTLLPMDQDVFTRSYFSLLAKRVAPLGYEPKGLVDAIWRGTAAMVKNDGSVSNETAFWRSFAQTYGEASIEHKPLFDEFYRTEFEQARSSCGFAPEAAALVRTIRTLGLRPVLATNPIFPAVATRARIRWAGLEPEDFELYTTYENSSFCKPNPAYYTELIQKLRLKGRECLMIGNDAAEDMAAREIGIHVFLLTNCLINSEQKDISQFPNGGFEQAQEYIEELAAEPEA